MCTYFKTKNADAHRQLTAAEAEAGATRGSAAPGGSARSVSSSVAATSAYYMSMSAAHAEAGGVCGGCVCVWWKVWILHRRGGVGSISVQARWRGVAPPVAECKVVQAQPFSQKSRTPTVAKEFQIGLYDPAEADLELFCNSWGAGFLGERLYVNIVFHKVDASMRAVLASLVGGCYQCDGWTGPNGEQVFCVLFGAPLPFYVSSFRIAGRRESADTLVDQIKEQLSLVEGAVEESSQTFHNTGFVKDSPNVNRSARTKLLEADVFSFA